MKTFFFLRRLDWRNSKQLPPWAALGDESAHQKYFFMIPICWKVSSRSGVLHRSNPWRGSCDCFPRRDRSWSGLDGEHRDVFRLEESFRNGRVRPETVLKSWRVETATGREWRRRVRPGKTSADSLYRGRAVEPLSRCAAEKRGAIARQV